MAKLSDIEGIGPSYAAKLKSAGVGSQASLLKHCATKSGRKNLSEKISVSEKIVLEWVNRADLARVKGVGGQYADLLENAGVDSVPELANRSAANLHKKMGEVNAAKKLVRQLPALSKVENWVAQAKKLDRVVKY